MFKSKHPMALMALREQFWQEGVTHPRLMLRETFSEMLIRLIDERGIPDAEAYKRARLSRQLFSKIRSDRCYHPSKRTVFAFALALELSLEETEALMQSAGYMVSGSQQFDVIVSYFIQRRCYDFETINEILYVHGLVPFK